MPLQAEDLLLALTDPARWTERLGEYAQDLQLGFGRLSIEHAVEAFLWPVRLMVWIGPIGLGLGFAADDWLWHRAQLRVPDPPQGPRDLPPPAAPPSG